MTKVKMLREFKRDAEFVNDEMFAKLSEAADTIARLARPHCMASEWWRALLMFKFLTWWDIGATLSL